MQELYNGIAIFALHIEEKEHGTIQKDKQRGWLAHLLGSKHGLLPYHRAHGQFLGLPSVHHHRL